MYSLKLATRRGMRYEYYQKCLFLAWLGVGFVCADFRNIFLQTKMNPLFGKSKSNTLHFETNLFKKMG